MATASTIRATIRADRSAICRSALRPRSQYAEPQYVEPQYVEPQYADQRYSDPRQSGQTSANQAYDQTYADPRYGDPRYSDPRYAADPRYDRSALCRPALRRCRAPMAMPIRVMRSQISAGRHRNTGRRPTRRPVPIRDMRVMAIRTAGSPTAIPITARRRCLRWRRPQISADRPSDAAALSPCWPCLRSRWSARRRPSAIARCSAVAARRFRRR